MVRSMLSRYKLHKSFLIEFLKTTAFILNRVPTKVVSKIPFKLFKGWKPSLTHNMYGDARLKLEFRTHKKRNWILGPLADISLDMPNLKDTDSTVYLTVLGLWNQEMQVFLKMT